MMVRHLALRTDEQTSLYGFGLGTDFLRKIYASWDVFDCECSFFATVLYRVSLIVPAYPSQTSLKGRGMGGPRFDIVHVVKDTHHYFISCI